MIGERETQRGKGQTEKERERKRRIGMEWREIEEWGDRKCVLQSNILVRRRKINDTVFELTWYFCHISFFVNFMCIKF